MLCISLSVLGAGLFALPGALATKGPSPGQIKKLATFGDSYTDTVTISNGGTQWPIYASDYANVTLYPFARSGAPCSQLLTPRPFPAVVQDELPAYFAEVANGTIQPEADDTLYTLWIGTNDLGPNTLLTGGQTKGVTVVDTTKCAIDWVKTLYDSGARNFLWQNVIPLERTPLYANDSYTNHYWTRERNTTEWHLFMTELSVSANEIARLMLEALPASLPGAHIGLFDSHALFTSILDNPSAYLNGTAPLNTTGAVKSCVYELNESPTDTGVCTIANGTGRDSFVWYDELHPSEQSDRIVAREIANTILGVGSNFTTWFS